MAQRQMARGDRDAAQGRLQAIVEQADRVTEMLETFVDAARITAGRLPLRVERTDLREAFDAALEKARTLVTEHGERPIEIDIPGEIVGAWDRARTIRAMRSLLTNALQYGDPTQPVRATARRDGDRATLTICGAGPGPDEEEQLHLFERFYRGRSASEIGQSGSGLGLYTARGIARAQGGEVRRVEGDTFELELPLTRQ